MIVLITTNKKCLGVPLRRQENGNRGNYKEPHRRFIQLLLVSSLVGQLSPNIDRIERSHWPFDAVSKTSSNDMHLAFLIQHASVNKSARSIVCMHMGLLLDGTSRGRETHGLAAEQVRKTESSHVIRL